MGKSSKEQGYLSGVTVMLVILIVMMLSPYVAYVKTYQLFVLNVYSLLHVNYTSKSVTKK